MQTVFSSPPFTTELFTRERRRTRLRQFLASFETQEWTAFPPGGALFPLKVAELKVKERAAGAVSR